MIQLGWWTERGPRTENQDATGAWGIGDRGVAVLTDGMGGEDDGAWTAKQVCDVAIEAAKDARFDGNPAVLIRIAHEQLRHAQDVKRSRGGTTCTIAVVEGRRVRVAWVGDSPAIHITPTAATLLTWPHNIAGALFHKMAGEKGWTEDDYRKADSRNILLMFCGKRDGRLEIGSTDDVQLLPGHALVLATDGAYDPLGSARIADIVRRYPTDPWSAARDVVQTALTVDAHDNATAMVLLAP